ncbi:transmembrane protease serine 9-like [Sergentomyia squamirostris]
MCTFLWSRTCAQQVLTSPCRDVFEYESSSSNNDEWHGVLHLRSTVTLHGIFIDIILDRQVQSLGTNYRFSVTTTDNMEYRMDDRSFKLRPAEQTDLRFFVRYSSYQTPRVKEVRLNGQIICRSATTSTVTSSTTTKTNNDDRSIDPALYYQVFGQPGQNTGPSRDSDRSSHNNQPVTTRSLIDGSDITFIGDSNRNRQHQTTRTMSTQTMSSTPYYTPTSLSSQNDQNSSSNRRTVNSVSSNNNYDQPGTVTTRPQNTRNINHTFNSSPDDVYGQGIRTTTENYGINRNRETNIGDTNLRAMNARTTTKSPYFQGDLSKFASPREREATPSLSFDTCGEVARKSNPLIVSGEETYRGQFPWHAALYISSGPQLKYTCGGNLINKKTILTAAHCVALKDTTRAMEPAQLLIYLGKSNLLQWQGPEQDVKVSEIIIHPDYDNEKFYSDLAIVKLKTEARFSEYVRPVCLWSFNKELRGIVNKIGRVPGFGYNEYGIVDDKLSYVNMPVVTHETCIWSNRDFFSRITSNASYCAGFKNGSSVCNGDSGGGMVFKENNKWYLRGIVSVSIALQNHFLCDPDHYAIFTDVAQFIDWIKDQM